MSWDALIQKLRAQKIKLQGKAREQHFRKPVSKIPAVYSIQPAASEEVVFPIQLSKSRSGILGSQRWKERAHKRSQIIPQLMLAGVKEALLPLQTCRTGGFLQTQGSSVTLQQCSLLFHSPRHAHSPAICPSPSAVHPFCPGAQVIKTHYHVGWCQIIQHGYY